jgi:Family of unknown function (DUF6298)
VVKFSSILVFLFSAFFCNINLYAQKTAKPLPPLFVDEGKLFYTTDSLGNLIPNFSYCGYKASEAEIPQVEVKVVVPILKGDATNRIQAAIDYVSNLPLNQNGFRGTVLLNKGTYEVFGQLKINASGVVLSGSGISKNGTTIIGTSTSRETLINIIGNKTNNEQAFETKITDTYVAVNSMKITVDSSFFVNQFTAEGNKIHTNNQILIRRPSTQKWISKIGTDIFGGGISALGWKPGDRDLFFYRTITKMEGNTLFLDAPITTALDAQYGGAYVSKFNDQGIINNCAVENIRLISSFDKNNLKDEDHRWNAINIQLAEDCWVRQVNFENFAGSAVSVLETSKRITIEDCISLNPISEIGGQRRYTFFTTGQQTLFQRCYAENGYHDFATGFCASGPNSFVQCESKNAYSFSGAIDSWASGVLFDIVNIEGNALRFGNRGQDANGAGWAAANSVFWNCTAARIDCYKPPTAQNWSFGSWAQFSGDGYWGESNNVLSPRSLFYAQLAERLNKNVNNQSQILFTPSEASSSPSVQIAGELTAQAAKPRMQLKEWIENANKRNPININATNAAIISITKKLLAKVVNTKKLFIENGWLINETNGNAKILFGQRLQNQWWSGGLQGKDLKNAKPHITRYVPGKVGRGLTDNLNEVVAEMVQNKVVAFEHNYGLWYERRRDDHQRVKRMDGEVWAPFYELPFARSGKDTAWDGLSKYDLTKYNPFYWDRLKQFAILADINGLVLIHQNYFQHNIIEAGAHYSDFPWRTANNINNTGFPEPPPYAGDKRIFMAEQFYDITNPVRKNIHKKYIRQCLNNFKDNSNVIQFIGEEFTGPLHFVQFWLDEIALWQKQNGKHGLIGLSVTKDVQDSILQNPKYAKLIDVIDIRYWHYQADGTTYEPKGGQNLAPRQHARLLKPKKSSFEQVYRAVKEYKNKYPSKEVMYSGDSYTEFGVASFMAGGSLAQLPLIFTNEILAAAKNMKPIASDNLNEYVLSNGIQSIIYNSNTKTIQLK